MRLSFLLRCVDRSLSSVKPLHNVRVVDLTRYFTISQLQILASRDQVLDWNMTITDLQSVGRTVCNNVVRRSWC